MIVIRTQREAVGRYCHGKPKTGTNVDKRDTFARIIKLLKEAVPMPGKNRP